MIENQPCLIFPLSIQDLRTLIHEEIEACFKKFMSVKEKELLPIKEVSKRIGISSATLHAWCKGGRLINRKVDGSSRTMLNLKEGLAAF